MSNKRKVRQEPPRMVYDHSEPIDYNQELSPEDLEKILSQRPTHPDCLTIAAACLRNDRHIEEQGQPLDELIQQFCDPKSLKYISVQRALRGSQNNKVLVSLAAAWIDGFMAACVCQDRAIIDMHATDYEEYRRDENQRQDMFEKFRRQDSNVFQFSVDRKKKDDRTFSKSAMEWLHDTLWLFLAGRLAAHWDTSGQPAKRATINVQVYTE